MMIGRCCRCKKTEPVTIKGLTASTGVTEWEYGPGSLWAQHYGADEISGIVNEWTANNRFVLVAGMGYFASTPGVRTSGALEANSAECLKLVKIDSTDGTEIESATMAGVFAYSTGSSGAFWTVNATRMTGQVGLSGGDYLMPHSLDPAIEWDDYTTDTANKEYTLHAHTLQGGSVYFRTKTSSETIAVPYNATASVVKSLFEATSDCVSATATGGPWPLVAINLDVTWSQTTGDISGLKFDRTYTAGGAGSCLFQWDAGTSTWVLVSDSCNPGPAEEPTTSGTYDGEVRAGTCPVSFPPPTSGTRDTRASAISWDTGTGAINNTVATRFGLGSGSVPSKLISETAGTVPTVTTLANSGIESDIYAGASNSVLVFGYGGTNGRTVEGWTVGSTWSRIWQRYANGDLWAGRYAWAKPDSGAVDNVVLAQSGKLAVCVKRRIYDTTEKAGTVADIAAGTFTAFDEPEVSTSTLYDNNAAFSMLLDGSGSDRLVYSYDRLFSPSTSPSSVIRYNLGGSQFKTPSKRLLLGFAAWGFPLYGVDSNRIYTSCTSFSNGTTVRTWNNTANTEPPSSTGTAYAGSISRTYRWRFYSYPEERYNAGEWRLKFVPSASSGLPTKTTGWLDWQCSSADVVNAVLAVFPENTEGVVSNIRVNPFGASNVTDNSPSIGLIEANIDLHFQGASTLGFIDTRYLNRPSSVVVEVRSLSTYTTSGGIAAWSATDGSVIWSRNFGTTASPAKTYAEATGGWLRGSRLYVYGPVVDNEL